MGRGREASIPRSLEKTIGCVCKVTVVSPDVSSSALKNNSPGLKVQRKMYLKFLFH